MTIINLESVSSIDDLLGYRPGVLEEFIIALEQLLNISRTPDEKPSIARAWELLCTVRGTFLENIKISDFIKKTQKKKIEGYLNLIPVATKQTLKIVSGIESDKVLAVQTNYIKKGKRGFSMKLKYLRKTKCYYNLDKELGVRIYELDRNE